LKKSGSIEANYVLAKVNQLGQFLFSALKKSGSIEAAALWGGTRAARAEDFPL